MIHRISITVQIKGLASTLFSKTHAVEFEMPGYMQPNGTVNDGYDNCCAALTEAARFIESESCFEHGKKLEIDNDRT